ncbi:MAG: hypothetical protein GX633_05150 [Clostridiales bacterium]|nr:hypothetical protein [Clostridiales bacterium]
MKRSLAIVLALLMLLGLFAGCSSNKGSSDAAETKTETKTEEKKEETKKESVSSGAKKEDQAKKEETKKEEKKEEAAPVVDAPTKITAFMQEAGQTFPDPFSHIDDWLTKEIAAIANIEFTELIVPAYTDTETKFNLMMAGGDIPDYIHRAHRPDMRRYGEEGAFADITDIIRSSDILSPLYTDVQISVMKDSSGAIHVLDTLPINDDYSALFVREDLLEKAGYTGDLVTVDDYLAAMRAVKAWDPNAIVYTCRALAYQQWFLTQPFNVANTCGWAWYPERDAYCNNWEGDNIVKSLEFARTLYKEKLIDPEFMTNNGDDVNQKRLKENCLIWAQNRGGIVARMEMIAADGQSDARMIPHPMPIAEGVGIDAYRTSPNLYGGHCIAFNAKCDQEKFDACVRLVETLLSDEVYILTCYGREGVEFEWNSAGNPTPLFPAAKEATYKSWLGYAYTYNTAENMNFNSTIAIYANAGLSDDEKAAYADKFVTAFDKIQDEYLCSLDYSPTIFLEAAPDEINNMVAECNEYQMSMYAKCMLGEISLEDFVAQKDETVAKYQAVTDYYKEKIDEVKAKYDLTYSK